jgi:predicted phosphodiesterase
MKLIAIGDTHGRTAWKKIVTTTEFDKVVFVGDYFDSKDGISPEQQLSNFEDLIAYKKENTDKVVLLFGNHDYHYLRTVDETYGGFQELHKTAIQNLLHEALEADLLQMCFIHKNYIFSHAGVTKTWLSNTGYTGKSPLDIYINDLFKSEPSAFKFTLGYNYSSSGDDTCQSPIWVRPLSLYSDAIDGYIQVVGHTTQSELEILGNKLVLIDTIGISGQFLSITNGEMSIVGRSRAYSPKG